MRGWIAFGLVCVATPAGAASALPSPPLVFTVTPAPAGAAWRLRVENTGEVPFRLAADTRLLTLDVTPPPDANAKKKPKVTSVTCRLPEAPSADEGRELVIPGKRSWTASFDPLLYCFADKAAALVPNAVITPRLGFPLAKKAKPVAPFVATPVGAAVSAYAPAKELEGATFTLTEAALADAKPSEPPKGVWLSSSASIDASRGVDISMTITLANDSDRAISLLFRPETVDFTVSGPGGSVRCPGVHPVDSPIRELFSTVGPKGRTSQTLLLTAICPSETFDTAGVYRVKAKVDTTAASGRPVGIKSWDDTAETRVPTLIRVRTSKRTAEPTRPTLD